MRADDTNPDFRPGDDTQIHWGKFSLMAKMILTVTTYQRRFQDTAAFTFPERLDIREMIMGVIVMDEQVSLVFSEGAVYLHLTRICFSRYGLVLRHYPNRTRLQLHQTPAPRKVASAECSQDVEDTNM